ncbi:hypothetical protein QAD02_004463 [Eretmocerus hayati]|uniref:Uncharacterized protein n=1 Tax=Eretmocerus hayati TaxID=131215 RepID=A0ACC2NQP2_9HYME|nr:hypothetical protein QAD02_004463 [Eretmocerus hayati]
MTVGQATTSSAHRPSHNRYRDDKTLLLSSFSSQKSNRFDKDSTGPFIVHIFDAREDENLGNYHLTEVGQRFFNAKISIIDLQPVGPVKYAVKLCNYTEANEFIENDSIMKLDKEWRAFIPDSSIFQVGLIYRVHPSITNDEILAGLDDEALKLVKKVERLTKAIRTSEGTTVALTEKIKIYAKNTLPTHVRLFGCIFREVECFIPAILRCYKCQRFGHAANLCKSEARCSRCGKNHEFRDCSNTPRCSNCRLSHDAADHRCIHFRFNKEVNLVRFHHRISRAEAIFRVQENFKKSIESDPTNNKTVELNLNNPYVSKRYLIEKRGVFASIKNEEDEVEVEHAENKKS